MKKLFLLATAIFCAVTGIFFSKKLPAETTEFTEKKYDTWAGVIRVWAEDSCGAAGWLNVCAGIAEKKLNGVYINIQEVSSETIRTYADSGVNLPDIIVYNNHIDNTSLFSPITGVYPLKDGIHQSAYAVPMLTRPRLWIYNTSVYDVLPGDMYGVRAACSPEDVIALTALCTGARTAEGTKAALPGLDIGLGGDYKTEEVPAGDILCRVQPDIIKEKSPIQLFRKGEADAFVGGISDVLKLENCAAAFTGKYAYASDVVMLSIIKKDDGRGDACRVFLDTLMGEGQALAARAQAFPSAVGVSAWEGDHLLAGIEAASEGKIWLAGAYDDSAAYLYIEGTINADEAVERIVGGT